MRACSGIITRERVLKNTSGYVEAFMSTGHIKFGVTLIAASRAVCRNSRLRNLGCNGFSVSAHFRLKQPLGAFVQVTSAAVL
jgi:hypothetical protein